MPPVGLLRLPLPSTRPALFGLAAHLPPWVPSASGNAIRLASSDNSYFCFMMSPSTMDGDEKNGGRDAMATDLRSH